MNCLDYVYIDKQKDVTMLFAFFKNDVGIFSAVYAPQFFTFSNISIL